jgi:MYXO-CTERM domain-containing protein
MRNEPTMRRSVLLLMTLAAVVLRPAPARACGGFFCNQPNNPFDPPSVVQTGENVLFAVNPDPAPGAPKIEAHIQIYYSGPASKFSWVLPIDAEPTLDVGSDAVFTALDAVTHPKFQVSYHDEGTCKPSLYPPTVDTAGGTKGAAGPAGMVQTNGSVDVSFQGAVGPYDAAVISSTDPQALKAWLADNMYYVSDQASSIIDTYVGESKHFVALRLLNGQDVQSIRPIILRFDAAAPCVPLRLTAIAAVDDMRVNLWVLADRRSVPINYLEIAVNLAKIDWLGSAGNYDKLLKEAADEAGGDAFTAEYAGTARLMDRQLWYDGRYNLPKLRSMTTPPAYLAEIAAEGFARDAKLLALLEKYIPEPASLAAAGVAERTFYNQLSSYWAQDMAEFAPFDPNAMTDELDSTIVMPLENAQGLFDRFPYLTRLATLISPEEMTKDPIFLFNGDLGDVPVVRQADATYECGAMLYSHCDANVRVRLPDGRTLRFAPVTSSSSSSSTATCFGMPSGGYAHGDIDALPSLQAAWQRAESGPGTTVIDKNPVIDKGVGEHNAGISGGCGCSTGGTGFGGAGALAATLALLAVRRRRGPAQ